LVNETNLIARCVYEYFWGPVIQKLFAKLQS
jgi:hypothetical protein